MREPGIVAGHWYEDGAYQLNIIPELGLTANSDIVSLYLQPGLGLSITRGSQTVPYTKERYTLAYEVYGEITITPIKNLEWYFEAELGNVLDTVTTNNEFGFNGTTGITWYLPAL